MYLYYVYAKIKTVMKLVAKGEGEELGRPGSMGEKTAKGKEEKDCDKRDK